MNRILFDLLFSQPLGGSKYHGGGEYMKRVFYELLKNYSSQTEITAFYRYDAFLDDWIKKLIRDYAIKTIDVKDLSELCGIINSNYFDVFYTGMPYHYTKQILPDSIHRIATFHGMRAVECPHDEYEYKYYDSKTRKLKERIRNVLKNSKLGYEKNRWQGVENYRLCMEAFDRLVCDSEHTKYSLLNYYPQIREDEITVLYAPRKITNINNNANSVNDGHCKEPYILLLGGNRWIKNAYRGIKAIDDLYTRDHIKDVKTIIVGRLSDTITSEIIHKNNFINLNYVDDDKLEDLYKNCLMLLYPTLNEGFGYPPLEAMAYGKTCIVSNVCSLHEVCGNAVYYVNPTDVGEIQNRILQAIYKPISFETVSNNYQIVSEKQDSDLQKLCELLVNA